MIPLVTERLILRSWRDEDRPPFAAMNADPEVMRYFPATLSREESDALVDRLIEAEQTFGMTFFATEEQASGRFIGLIGMRPSPDFLPTTPDVEIGWRLARDMWGRGLATEAARALLRVGFGELGIERIVAFTSTANLASRRVMEKIGLRREAEGDFDHPKVPDGPLQRQVLYAVSREAWLASPPATTGA